MDVLCVLFTQSRWSKNDGKQLGSLFCSYLGIETFSQEILCICRKNRILKIYLFLLWKSWWKSWKWKRTRLRNDFIFRFFFYFYIIQFFIGLCIDSNVNCPSCTSFITMHIFSWKKNLSHLSLPNSVFYL